MDNIEIIKRAATVDEFIEMRQSTGWEYPERKLISIGLENTLFSVWLEKNKRIIGYGRVIGDGAFTLYIQDIIIKPEYQRMGLGMKVMIEIMEYINIQYPKDTMVGLMSVKGKENFYKKFGFTERPNEEYGAGMIQFIKNP